MANKRIKDLSTINPATDTYLALDSVGTGTGKAEVNEVVRAGLVDALAANTDVLDFNGVGVTGMASLQVDTGASFGDDVTVAGHLSVTGGIDGNGSGLASDFLDPVDAQDLTTKTYVDTLDALNAAATFDAAGVLLSTTDASLFTGDATLSDTSLFDIPFAGASGTYVAVANTSNLGNANFCSVGYTGAPTALRVRIWKYDGTKEAMAFSVIVRRGAA